MIILIIALMKIYEDFDLDLKSPVSNYLPELKKSNKSLSTFFEVLSHTAGWAPYITHQKKILKKNGKYKNNLVRNKKSQRFAVMINEKLFLKNSYQKKMFRSIKKSELKEIGDYLYSGLFFFYVPKLIKVLTNMTYENYLNKNFYDSIW